MANAEKTWTRISIIGTNVPVEELIADYEDRSGDSGPTHYLLLPDATLIANRRAIVAGEPIGILVVAEDGESCSAAQMALVSTIEDFVAQWVARPADPGLSLPPALAAAEEARNRFYPNRIVRSASSVPARRAPATPPWPSYADPGPFSGSPEQLRALAPHIVNLRKGKLSDDGIASTTEAGLDDIVEAIAEKAARGFKLMLYAHGGLTDERYGLASAWAYHRWWLSHGVYPLFFVWETGGLETFWQIVEGEERRGRAMSRDIWDYTTDPAVEMLGGKVGKLLWRAMKDSARSASLKGGGAQLFAEKLAARLDPATDIFAIGHSAGSIFHAHFLPVLCANALKVRHLHLLAPAITNRLFADQLIPMIGGKIGQCHMFALTREAERGDNCARVYHKSLLYLVSRAFEDDKEEPILGMEDFQRDAVVRGAFADRIILSPTPRGAPPSAASASRTHGGFDNDVPTIESILRRVKDIGDDELVRPGYPQGEPRVQRAVADANYYGVPPGLFGTGAMPLPNPVAAFPAADPATPAAQAPVKVGGQRVALCIGNDAFAGNMRLHGCVNDAQTWAETFRLQGHEPKILANVTARQIRDEIRGVLARSRPGDSVMIHVSSHGSQALDVDGDEALGDSQYADDKDELLVALDWEDGGLIIDDEWPMLLSAPQGVKLVRFHDFCHSGRTSRMAFSPTGLRRRRSWNIPDSIAQKAYRATPQRALPAEAYGTDLPYLTFCACEPHQFAMEDNGAGIFTQAATEILRGRGATLGAQEAFAAIKAAMGNEQQNPVLEGSALFTASPLFGLPS
ncbi:caspase family protein [Sphingobium sp.]|uniref:caspase family protein n=1 Tax=Sphingobium sp. TaxID=1912891 RepID=UPI002CCC735C|nr:caspase family protein [Sphingobium sp.]HUD94544.1 caspase family protein [Sphingobium sp.]